MNILFLHNKITQSCGITRIMSNIAREKNYWGNNNFFLIVGLDDLKNKKYYLPFKKFKIFHSNLIFDIIFIINFCVKNNIQVISSFHRYYDLIAVVVSKIINVKTITIVQSKVFGKKKLSYHAQILIAVSHSIKSHLNNEFKIQNDKIQVIHNFIDTNDFNIIKSRYELLNILNIKKEEKIIGFIGRINNEEKGVDILLKAFQKIKDYRLTLLLIGSGPDEEYVKSFAKKNNLNIILIKETENVYDYYNLFDLFILPSRVEPFGIVLLEAGYMRIPIIASNVDGIPEIIKNMETGFLFEPGNVNDLIYKIRFYLENPKVGEEFAQNLFDKILNNFTSKKIIPQYQQLYNSMIGN